MEVNGAFVSTLLLSTQATLNPSVECLADQHTWQHLHRRQHFPPSAHRPHHLFQTNSYIQSHGFYTRPSISFRFLALPQEVGDYIYDEILTTTYTVDLPQPWVSARTVGHLKTNHKNMKLYTNLDWPIPAPG